MRVGAIAALATVILATTAAAKMPVDERIRQLEEALKAAQEEIKELREEVREQKEAKPAVPPEKPVEDAKAKKPSGLPVKASYGIGKGITVETEDNRFKVSLYNRFQGRYTYTNVPDGEDESTFRVRRMKTTFEGHAFDPTLSFKLQANWADPGPELEDALLNWRPRAYAGVQGGQYKVPFDRQQLTSSGAQQFVDRSIASDYFTLARDQGVMLTGSWFGEKNDLLEWNGGVFNGNGLNRQLNDGSGQLWDGRLLFMPLGKFDYYVESDVADTPEPRLGVGVAGAYNDEAQDTDDAARIFGSNRLGSFFEPDQGPFDIGQSTADVHFKWRGLSAVGDYFWAEVDPATGASRSGHGYNFQTGYFILPKRVEAAFRVSGVDVHDEFDQREIGGAIGYFFLAHNLKIQADVRDIRNDPVDAGSDHTLEFRAQVQAIF
jgi:hypothetical protein